VVVRPGPCNDRLRHRRGNGRRCAQWRARAAATAAPCAAGPRSDERNARRTWNRSKEFPLRPSGPGERPTSKEPSGRLIALLATDAEARIQEGTPSPSMPPAIDARRRLRRHCDRPPGGYLACKYLAGRVADRVNNRARSHRGPPGGLSAVPLGRQRRQYVRR